MFSKWELLFLDQANCNSDPSQIPILWFPHLELPCLPHHRRQILPWQTETCLKHNPHSFSYFLLPYSTTRNHKYWIYQTIWQSQPIKFIIKLYTLWLKHANHQEAESLRDPSLSKLDSTVNNNSIFNTKYAEFLTKCFFIFTILLVHTTIPTISTKNSFLYFTQLSPPYYILDFKQNHLDKPH